MNEVNEKKAIRGTKGLSTKGYVGPVILELLMFLVVAVLCSAFDSIPAIKQTGYLSIILSALIVLLGFKLWFAPLFKGNLKVKDRSFDVFLPFIVILVVDIVLTAIFGEVSLSRITFKMILMAIAAGVSEEVMNRVFPVALMLRNKLSKKNLWPIMIISSLIFGLVHFGNVIRGAAVGVSLIQVVTTFCMGLMFCVLYMRSGSIVLPMILHAVHDFIGFLDVSGVNESGVVVQIIDAKYLFVETIYALTYVLLAVYLMRPSKRESVVEIWKEKWSM